MKDYKEEKQTLSDGSIIVKYTKQYHNCFYCNRKATYNLKFIEGKPVIIGDTIDLGADEKYRPVCKYCFSKQINI